MVQPSGNAGDSSHSGPADASRTANDKGTADASNRTRRLPLVTTRVGLIFLIVSLSILVCAVGAHTVSEHKLNSLMWIAALATCSVGGLVAMNSVRTLRVIESELRCRQPGKRQWQTARQVIGADPITLGWNQLLEDIADNQRSDAPRLPATLDQEAVTLARAMRGMPVAWVITDGEGVIRLMGPAACGLLNLAEDENHGGRDLIKLLGLDGTADECDDAVRNRMLGPIRMVHEHRQLTVGDRTLHLRITRSRLGGRSGDGEGLAWVLHDVTQQRIATEARDQFLMTATHELRTPLTNLQAYAEALHEEKDLEVERQKEFCNVIHSEANRLGRLVEQLLTVSQMEAGSMVANRHDLELHPMLEYAAEQLQAQATQKNISLTSNLSAKLPTVIGDRDKLQAALVNLVGNAVKYTPEGGHVAVRCAADERWIRIDVEDDGPGIEEDEQIKVFEKFYRGKNTISEEQRGNGIGLAFAREIARLHGGDIELQSVPGDGSLFTLTLPVGGRSRSGV